MIIMVYHFDNKYCISLAYVTRKERYTFFKNWGNMPLSIILGKETFIHSLWVYYKDSAKNVFHQRPLSPRVVTNLDLYKS